MPEPSPFERVVADALCRGLHPHHFEVLFLAYPCAGCRKGATLAIHALATHPEVREAWVASVLAAPCILHPEWAWPHDDEDWAHPQCAVDAILAAIRPDDPAPPDERTTP